MDADWGLIRRQLNVPLLEEHRGLLAGEPDDYFEPEDPDPCPWCGVPPRDGRLWQVGEMAVHLQDTHRDSV